MAPFTARSHVILSHAFLPVDNQRLAHLCGATDAHLRDVESAMGVRISRRNEVFSVAGRKAQAQRAVDLLQSLYDRAARPWSPEDFQLALVQAVADPSSLPRVAAQTVDDEPEASPPASAARTGAGAGAGAKRGAAKAAARQAAARQAAGTAAKPMAAPAPTPVGQPPARPGSRSVARPAAGAAAAAAAEQPVLRTRRADLAGRTPNQQVYLQNILSHDISFGIGPAGTGKTFLAVACAVDALERSTVQRIILTRPAVEAGERLGFLPGDLAQKVDPYLRPLYDALYDLMGLEKVGKAFEKGLIEVAPLAFMRGRTLNHAFVILDEAQNTTPEQMKMFLTRIGFGSKCVVTGDVSQVDLPRGEMSGLIDAERVLRRVGGIATTRFTAADVVRHPLVARIVEAYDSARGAAS